MQRGAAHIALAADSDILPVTITCDPPTLFKGNPWYRVPARRFHLHVVVGEPMAAREFIRDNEAPVLNRAPDHPVDAHALRCAGGQRSRSRGSRRIAVAGGTRAHQNNQIEQDREVEMSSDDRNPAKKSWRTCEWC